MDAIKTAMAVTAREIEAELDRLIPRGEGPERPLFEAMRYACLGGGKRLRPLLVIESAGLFDVPQSRALRTAAAVEFVHCYSLVHDDLPAMDDDDLRRGRPTCHKKFDEATAILAGDALLTLAFEVLAQPDTHPDPAIRAELVFALAAAAGPRGMVGGQMFDLAAERHGGAFPLSEITRLQALKTGRLIGFACEAGAILGEADARQRAALGRYARDLGLAFQIVDDLLDAEGNEAEVGKKLGKDAAAGKATFIAHLGVDGAREKARGLSLAAVSHLDLFPYKTQTLQAVARFVVDRRT